MKGLRKSSQKLLPAVKCNDRSGYDIYPAFAVGGGKIHRGYDRLADWIIGQETVVMDGYAGVYWDVMREQLNDRIAEKNYDINWLSIGDAFKDEKEIDRMIKPYLGGNDPVFGKIYPGNLRDFFAGEKLRRIKPEQKGITILYGSGASLAGWEAPLIYVDVPKNEIQYRSRAGKVHNIGTWEIASPKEQYKRFYFIDWIVLNRHKKELLPGIDIIVDEQRTGDIAWMKGEDFRNALDEMTCNMFRVRPWFEPGVWGGDWIKRHIDGVSPDPPNYAWSFELIVPENGIILESNGNMLEISFDFLMYFDNKNILGAAANRFGYEFPIRFDFLDTFDGGNLSLQCHPSESYIKEHFGENFTQDEAYYILDAEENARVYLGFQNNIDREAFRTALKTSFSDNSAVEVDKFVQTFPASKHDLFLIPNGTIHCSGKGNIVLEISSTPYIYTFKMYDWLRLDLDGKPRPINIDRAFDNLKFERRGERVKEELLSKPEIIEEGEDWQTVHLPTHPIHFYDVHRIEFDSSVTIKNEGRCHVLNLVEGSSITVVTGKRKQHIHYAETFVIPAAAGEYTLVNEVPDRAKVVKAFVK